MRNTDRLNLLFPKFGHGRFRQMLGIAFLGALIAGAYGILHDQITYSISPEYFSKMKFEQFSRANLGFPERVFVAEIGFLATWWVGFIAAWFLARLAVPAWPAKLAFRRCLIGMAGIFALAVLAGVAGFLLGKYHPGDVSDWADLCLVLGVKDVPAFVCVAYIHNASYLGAAAGLLISLAMINKGRVPSR